MSVVYGVCVEMLSGSSSKHIGEAEMFLVSPGVEMNKWTCCQVVLRRLC